MVANTLFLSNRSRPDIQPIIYVLATRVISPNIIDWKKLVRIFKYLNGTSKYNLMLSIDDMRVIKYYVDASFAVHLYLKIHTVGTTMWRTVVTQSGLMKKKLNKRSIIEAEVVSVGDMM